MPIPLHEPKITEADQQIVLEALKSQWVSTGGPFISRFEQDFAAFTGFRHAVSVGNGTLGLVLAIEVTKRLRGIKSPFHVLVPSLSFAATWNSVIEAGGIPLPVDCSENHINLSVKALRETLERCFYADSGQVVHRSSKAPLLAVMPAHILGWASEMDDIFDFCQSQNIALIEDAAESLGSRYLSDQKHLGHHGSCSVFSFNGNKILTTGGGGMLVTNDSQFASRAKHLATTAKIDNLRFVHDEPGFNFRMVNVLAALGVSQLARLGENLRRKREIAELYSAHLDKNHVSLYKQDNCAPNHWINTIRFKTELAREEALTQLINAGFECRPMWTPFHKLQYCELSLLPNIEFPNATAWWSTLMSLPSSPHLGNETIVEICRLINTSSASGS